MVLDAAAAIIGPEKLRDYLLSTTHPIGRYKSAFFRSLGYTQEHWQLRERDLRAVLSNEAKPSAASEYGQKFTVRSALSAPNGRSAGIVSVWIILGGETAPRFVTAYPEV